VSGSSATLILSCALSFLPVFFILTFLFSNILEFSK
jgi:hypothetical protein